MQNFKPPRSWGVVLRALAKFSVHAGDQCWRPISDLSFISFASPRPYVYHMLLATAGRLSLIEFKLELFHHT